MDSLVLYKKIIVYFHQKPKWKGNIVYSSHKSKKVK